MRPRFLLAALVATLISPGPVAGQATVDQARLVFGVGIGQRSGGGTLWFVGRQPFITGLGADTVAVGRNFRPNLALLFSGTYFPGDHFGMTAEVQLLGLGTTDSCRIVTAGGDPSTALFCNALDGSRRSAGATAISVGAIYRVGSHQPIHVYGLANVGFVVAPSSFIRTTADYFTPGEFTPTSVALYPDDGGTSIRPTLALGGGVVTVIGRGYQLRFELRDNWVGIPAVTGATSRQGIAPPSSITGKHFLSFILAFDVVLERKRGRRY